MCVDHPEVQALVGRIIDRRIITYGRSPQADVRLTDLSFDEGDCVYDVIVKDRPTGETRRIERLRLPMPGEHNALNSLAALAIADQLDIPDEVVRKALGAFGGVRRRFTKTGVWNGVAIFDDYGHHPVEIAAVLKAGRRVTKGKVVAVVQPHRYTRLRDLFNEFCTCFNDADAVIVAPVYEAGEAPIEGVNRDALVEGMMARGHRHAVALDRPEDLAGQVAALVTAGDIVICLGAGSITQWANALPLALEKLGTTETTG
jgi:UDP-N-acetylmuramate--alanine ligase